MGKLKLKRGFLRDSSSIGYPKWVCWVRKVATIVDYSQDCVNSVPKMSSARHFSASLYFVKLTCCCILNEQTKLDFLKLEMHSHWNIWAYLHTQPSRMYEQVRYLHIQKTCVCVSKYLIFMIEDYSFNFVVNRRSVKNILAWLCSKNLQNFCEIHMIYESRCDSCATENLTSRHDEFWH